MHDRDHESQHPEAEHRPPDRRPASDLGSAPNASLGVFLGRQVDRDADDLGAGPLDPAVAGEIRHAQGGGSSLPDDVRSDMEGHLGADLGAVRVHTDSKADHLSRSVQAEAFTTGADIFFKSGSYSPGSTDGRRLLGHELTHVVQQSTGDVGGGDRVSHPNDPHEREAAAVGDAIASTPAGAGAVDREAMPEEDELDL